MATLMIVIDGAENNEYAVCPTLRDIAPALERNNTPQGMDTDSLSCIMTILGVARDKIPSGRAYLEALALGLDVADEDLVFRCNYVDVDADGVLASSYRTGRVEEARNGTYELKYIEKHKYLLVVKDGARYAAGVTTFPPHQNVGRRLTEILPVAEGTLGQTLLSLIHERSIFPWGQAVKQETPTFSGIHGLRGAMIAKTEIVMGMAKTLDMECPALERATADVDTDLTEKAAIALDLCGRNDFVMLHINGADEAAHRRNKDEKLAFLADIDRQVIRYILDNAPDSLGVIVSADHETSAQTGRHVNSAVRCYCLNNTKECEKWLKP